MDGNSTPCDGKTMIFSLRGEKESEIHKVLQEVYDALVEKGYKKPLDQIAG